MQISEQIAAARKLSEIPTKRPEAREICSQILKNDPKNIPARLLLARLFFLDGLYEFSVRELFVLQHYQATPAIKRLIDSFGMFGRQFAFNLVGDSGSSDSQEVVAEIDIDAEFVDAIDEIDEIEK